MAFDVACKSFGGTGVLPLAVAGLVPLASANRGVASSAVRRSELKNLSKSSSAVGRSELRIVSKSSCRCRRVRVIACCVANITRNSSLVGGLEYSGGAFGGGRGLGPSMLEGGPEEGPAELAAVADC